jgi:hypothetical protein
MLYLAISVYALAMIAANLIVAWLGPWVSPINSFFLIGLDLALRDKLHMKLKPLQMFQLILITGVITFLLNPAISKIAIASSVSFMAASLVDWGVFRAVPGTWIRKSLWSNTAGASVDSVLFPTIAFGAFLPHIVALQFIAKTTGGAAWAYLLRPKAGQSAGAIQHAAL